MNPTKLKLTNPTDDELNAAVATHVCGYAGVDGGMMRLPDTRMRGNVFESWKRVPPYATSADAVLPLLDGFEWVDIGKDVDYNDGPWAVSISRQRAGAMGALFIGSAPALARAACIALLRANGIEVEITPQPAQK